MTVQINASDEMRQEISDFLQLFQNMGMEFHFANEGAYIRLKIKTAGGNVFDFKCPRTEPFILSSMEEATDE